jgi:hypothetical protein
VEVIVSSLECRLVVALGLVWFAKGFCCEEGVPPKTFPPIEWESHSFSFQTSFFFSFQNLIMPHYVGGC